MLSSGLRMEQEHYLADPEVRELARSIAHSPIATVITDNRLHDNPIIFANAAFVALTGYPEHEIVGRNCRFLAGASTEPEARGALRQAIERAAPMVVELTNYKKTGEPFRNAVMIAPVLDSFGNAKLFVGSQMDVSSSGSGLRSSRAKALLASLTKRQRQVLQRMTAGYRNKQIAGDLGIDETTVKMHRARLIRALGVSASADAVRIAVEGDLAISDPG